MTTIKMIQISNKNELKYDMKISLSLDNLHMTLNNNDIDKIWIQGLLVVTQIKAYNLDKSKMTLFLHVLP